MGDPRFHAFRVLRTAVVARSRTHDERQPHLIAIAVCQRGGKVHDLIHAAAQPVREHDFGDGPHAQERRADRRAHDRVFRDRGIDHASRAELVMQALGAPAPAIDDNILADGEHVGVASHFLEESEIDRLGYRQLRHCMLLLSENR